MEDAIIWDVELLTEKGAPQRFWCGPDDPDPVLVQIGAVKLGLCGDYPIHDRFERTVIPRDRIGAPWPITPFVTWLTGLTPERVARDGVELAPALQAFDAFTQGAPVWAWGNDEIFAIAISCYLAGIAPPMAATRFGNATRLLLTAGIEKDVIHELRSNTLAAHFDIETEGATAHDAVDDAMSTALALQHLLRQGRLSGDDFALAA